MKKIIISILIIFFIFFLVNCPAPLPILNSISPDTKAAHFPTFILTAIGSDFQSNSKIVFDGVEKTTNYVGSTELSCEIYPNDILTGGVIIPVLIRTPGGGDSDILNFTVTMDPSFKIPVNISNEPEDSRAPDVAADKEGNVNVVWSQFISITADFSDNEIYFTRSDDKGANWTPNLNISNNSQPWHEDYRPVIALDIDNVINVVWDARINLAPQWHSVRFSRSNGGSTWTIPVNVSGVNDVSRYSAIAIDSLNNIYVVWREFLSPPLEIYFSRSTDFGVNWSASVLISNSITTGHQHPRIAADNAGNIYVIWRSYDNEITYPYNVYFNKSDDYGITWSTAYKITNNGNSAASGIDVDSSGNIHVTYVDNSFTVPRVCYIRSTDQGVTWSTPNDISNHSLGAGGGRIEIDSADNINVVWIEDDDVPGRDIYFCRSIDGGQNWSTPINISNSTNDKFPANISTDLEGNIYVVWTEFITNSNAEIFFTRCVY